MKQIPCIDCLVFPICKSKAIISTPYIGVVGSKIISIDISHLSCIHLTECIGKTNLFQKRRKKRVDLIKHILNLKKLDDRTIYRLHIDNNIMWIDQFKGESLDYAPLYNESVLGYKRKRRRKK